MAQEPNVAKGGPKRPPVEMPTSVDQLAVTIANEPPEPLEARGANEGPSEKSSVGGKLVRKDPPAGGSTKPIAQETVATLPPEDSVEEPVMSAPKPSNPAPAGADKAATTLGDYKLLKKLGQGGMGAVYKAQHSRLERIVAIKVLAKELASKEAYVQRFQREAKVMLKADHPNILRCFDVNHDKGFHFIVMEFVDGGSVEGWLKKLGKFSIGDAMHIILKTAEGLQHAHDKSLIHRDIKPDNILLTKDGIVKVADLGLAKDTDEDTSLTKTGAGAGTPIYMAPEQARDVKHVDARVDIYALGVMMYVFLTGRAPFEGNTLVELISAKEKGKFDPIRKHNDEVPSKIDLIVDKMLSKDPKFRYASCQEVIDELEPLGLANETLTFLDSGDKTIAPAAAGKNKTQGPAVKAAKTQGPAKPGADTDPPSKPRKPTAKNVTKAPVNAAAQTQMAEDEEEETVQGVFYWKLVTQEGREVIKKVTVEQIRTLIKAGHLDAEANISKSEKSGYRPAGTFMEFHAHFKARETATKANIKAHKSKNKMQDIIDEDARRRKYGWISRMFKGFGGTIMGLLWIVLILGIVGGGGYFAWKYFSP